MTARATWVGFPRGLEVTLLQLKVGSWEALGCAHKPSWEKCRGFLLFPWILRSPHRISLSFLDRSIVVLQCCISFYCRAK